MPDEKEESPGFKVVDRRSFAAGGERRESHDAAASDVEPERPKARPEGPPEPAPPAREPAGPQIVADPYGSAEPLSEFEGAEADLTEFETLVSFLATTAWFQLGMIPGPGGERIQADFANARRTIDMLEVLETKTKGNLTAAEQKLLEDVLYELRLGFVEVEKRAAPKRK